MQSDSQLIPRQTSSLQLVVNKKCWAFSSTSLLVHIDGVSTAFSLWSILKIVKDLLVVIAPFLLTATKNSNKDSILIFSNRTSWGRGHGRCQNLIEIYDMTISYHCSVTLLTRHAMRNSNENDAATWRLGFWGKTSVLDWKMFSDFLVVFFTYDNNNKICKIIMLW